MQTFFSLLGFLACPLVMGGMLWVMARHAQADAPPARPPTTPRSHLSRVRALLACCLNGKVMTGLALLGLGIWLVAPQIIGSALPILLVAICPLSMLLMLLQMRRSAKTRVADLTRQLTALDDAPRGHQKKGNA